MVYAVMVISLLLSSLFITSSPSYSSVYDILPEYGLPKGLLPNCVKDYSFSPSDGKFNVELDHKCYVDFEYLVYYDTHISGTLKMGSITNLKGIQVKRFLFWFDVDEIRVDLPPSDSIYFQVGFINKRLGIEQFQTIHSCSSTFSSSTTVTATANRNRNRIFQLPPPVDVDIPMLLTE